MSTLLGKQAGHKAEMRKGGDLSSTVIQLTETVWKVKTWRQEYASFNLPIRAKTFMVDVRSHMIFEGKKNAHF